MNHIREIQVRHPYVNEVPAELLAGIEAFKIDPEWQWCLTVDGKIVAQILCANAHGVLMILRLTALKDAPHGWALTMFRRVFKDCSDLGLIGYITMLADSKRPECRLMTMIARSGGYLTPFTGVMAAGRFDIGY